MINDKFMNLISKDIDFNQYNIETCCNILYINYEFIDKELYNIIFNRILKEIDYCS